MRFSCLHTAVVVCLVYVPFHGGEASAAPSPPFIELLGQAQSSAPRLRESAALVDAASGRAKQAQAWPNPALGVEVENFAGSGPYRGSTQTQTTLSVSEPLELGGQRSSRVLAGRAELASARAHLERQRADFNFDLTLAYAAAEAGQSRAALLAEDLDRTQEDVRRTRALVDAGKEGELRAVQAEAAAAGARADLESARADAMQSLLRLSSLAGVSEPFTSVPASLLSGGPDAPAITNEIPIAAPTVIAARAELDLAERRVQVERKRALPVLSLSVGARRFAGEDATALVGGVSFSLPLFDRNRGAIAAARAERIAADARLAGAEGDLAAEWRSALAQATAGSARTAAAEQGQAAAAEGYRLARIGYESGRTSLLELLSTRRALIDAQLRVIEARLARVRANASLTRLSGQNPLGGTGE